MNVLLITSFTFATQAHQHGGGHADKAETVLISGIAQDLGVDKITVTLSRRVGGRWLPAGTFRVPLGGATSWALDVTKLLAGRYRAVASAAGRSDREDFTVTV